MSDKPPFDPRGVANLLLDLADMVEYPICHIALQKLLYFAHGLSLRAGYPLVRGGFEAWTHGPVQPSVYRCFKGSGSNPIRTRAHHADVVTGAVCVVPSTKSLEAGDVILKVLVNYGRMDPRRLVDLSHAKDGPWDVVRNKARTSVALGMKIPDNLIIERFVHHKMTVGYAPRVGAIDEDTPLAGYGFGRDFGSAY